MQYIIHPITGHKYNLSSIHARKLITNYIKLYQIGGAEPYKNDEEIFNELRKDDGFNFDVLRIPDTFSFSNIFDKYINISKDGFFKIFLADLEKIHQFNLQHQFMTVRTNKVASLLKLLDKNISDGEIATVKKNSDDHKKLKKAWYKYMDAGNIAPNVHRDVILTTEDSPMKKLGTVAADEIRRAIYERQPQSRTDANEITSDIFNIIKQEYVKDPAIGSILFDVSSFSEQNVPWPSNVKWIIFDSIEHIFKYRIHGELYNYNKCEFGDNFLKLEETQESPPYFMLNMLNLVCNKNMKELIESIDISTVNKFVVNLEDSAKFIEKSQLQNIKISEGSDIESLMNEENKIFGAYTHDIAKMLINYSNLWDNVINGYLEHGDKYFEEDEDYNTEYKDRIIENRTQVGYTNNSDKNIKDSIIDLTDKLINAIKERGTSLPQSIIVYRGGSYPKTSDGSYAKIGDEFIKPGMMSTSMNKDIAEDFAKISSENGPASILNITVPPGTNFLTLKMHSEFDHEKELLFNNDTKLKLGKLIKKHNVSDSGGEIDNPLQKGVIYEHEAIIVNKDPMTKFDPCKTYTVVNFTRV
jgi:ribosome-associated protein YbcJ (S4-like RNA binding protein)